MKKIMTLIVFFLIGIICYSQEKNVYVEYKHGQWLKTFYTTETLFANQESSRYDVKEIKSINKDQRGYTDSSGDIIILHFNSVKPTTLYKTKDDQNIYFNQFMNNDDREWLIIDNLPIQNWELISDNSKEINGYLCNMAKLKFRGSTYTAYYTNDIPISFGPWKFKGLPGLILEISMDENPIFYWKAETVIYPYIEKIDLGFDKKKFKTTYQAFIKEEDNLRTKNAKASMEKFAHLGPPTYTFKRVGHEKTFEWETIENKN